MRTNHLALKYLYNCWYIYNKRKYLRLSSGALLHESFMKNEKKNVVEEKILFFLDASSKSIFTDSYYIRKTLCFMNAEHN